MKCLKFFGIVFLMALFACDASDDKYEAMDTALKKAETIYQHPDGERYETAIADTSQMSTELIKAVKYFVSKKDYDKAAKACLYLGYSQKEADEKALAMKAFKDSENYGNNSNDSLTTARAQYNIAKMLLDDSMYNESICVSNSADNKSDNHNEEKAYINNLIAVSYIMKKDFTNAGYHLKQALAFAQKSKSTKAKIKILNNFSVYYREQAQYDSAIICLKQNILDNDSTQNLMCYLNLGKIYLYMNLYDSAEYYTHKALELSESIKVLPETLVSIHFSLYYIAKKQGNYQMALAYHENHETLLYKTQKEIEQKNLYSIQRKYDYEALQNKMNQKIIQKQRIILEVSFLLLLASIVVIGLLVRQKKLIKEDERIRKELEKAKDELHNSVKPKVVEKELSKQLHLILTANHIAEHADDFKKEWSPLVYKINNEKNNMFEAALVAIESVYPGIYNTILKKYPTLNETESKVMLLSCSDLSNREIGRILGLSVHSVNKCRSGINRVI